MKEHEAWEQSETRSSAAFEVVSEDIHAYLKPVLEKIKRKADPQNRYTVGRNTYHMPSDVARLNPYDRQAAMRFLLIGSDLGPFLSDNGHPELANLREAYRDGPKRYGSIAVHQGEASVTINAGLWQNDREMLPDWNEVRRFQPTVRNAETDDGPKFPKWKWRTGALASAGAVFEGVEMAGASEKGSIGASIAAWTGVKGIEKVKAHRRDRQLRSTFTDVTERISALEQRVLDPENGALTIDTGHLPLNSWRAGTHESMPYFMLDSQLTRGEPEFTDASVVVDALRKADSADDRWFSDLEDQVELLAELSDRRMALSDEWVRTNERVKLTKIKERAKLRALGKEFAEVEETMKGILDAVWRDNRKQQNVQELESFKNRFDEVLDSAIAISDQELGDVNLRMIAHFRHTVADALSGVADLEFKHAEMSDDMINYVARTVALISSPEDMKNVYQGFCAQFAKSLSMELPTWDEFCDSMITDGVRF